MDIKSVFEIVSVYYDRYNELKNKECANYILIIHNHGREPGFSFAPHSQILAIPFIPSDISAACRVRLYISRKKALCSLRYYRVGA